MDEQSSSSSSIGEDSDQSGGGGGDPGSEVAGEDEVQSKFERGPLGALGALEESLPMRRGISQHYHGKSKSFTSLADAASSSARGLAKPEDAYSRKRKNLLAYKTIWEKPCRDAFTSDGLSKRPAGSSRRRVHSEPAAAAACPVDSGVDSSSSISSSSSMEELDQAQLVLPPMRPLGKPASGDPSSGKCYFATRSFSLMDLQGIRGTSNLSG